MFKNLIGGVSLVLAGLTILLCVPPALAAPAAKLLTTTAPPPSAQALKAVATEAAACFKCHEPIKAFRNDGKHQSVGCGSCHGNLPAHNANEKTRPTTNVDPAACGSCHKPQFETLYKMNWAKTARKEKVLASGPSPTPAFDKLMMPHGFTREHNEPRSHAFALYDQVVVDRAFGGRYKNKMGWEFLTQPGGNFKIWSVLEDQFPGQDHKAFKPGTAAAANPVCMSCKSADHILDWAYMGDPVPGAKWSRTSKVVDFVKDVNHSLNCFFCHDPHSGGPRVVRDALLQAVVRPEKDTVWHADKNGAKIDIRDLGTRGFTRKIGLLSRPDSKLMCAQCHVEYNCNPGTDPSSGQPVTMADQRTNHFPLKKAADIGKHYSDLKFRDFKHGITGAMLWKGQHPDAENFYGSKHQLAGADCADCHMPKVKDPKTGRPFTSHWQTSPMHYVKETCLTCHEWTEQQAIYANDSLKNRVQGKVRKAEFWLTRMIDKFEESKGLGVDEAVLNLVREKHYEAHINWEWWTSSNGAHFHNPDEAVASLNKSMAISQEGIKLLEDAMAARRNASRIAPAAPVAASVPAGVAR